MKIACVVLQSKNVLSENRFFSITDTFGLCGFAFEELRILTETEEKTVLSALLALKAEYDCILLLCSRSALHIAKQYCSTAFPEGIYQGGLDGVGIYDSQKSIWVLLTIEDALKDKTYIEERIIPYLKRRGSEKREHLVIRAVGVHETHLERLFLEAKNRGGNQIWCHHVRNHGEFIIQISYNETAPKMLVDDIIRLFVDGLGECIYALENISLEEQLVRLLKLRGRKLSIAESFTGGGIARRIVSVPGASEVYFEGLNTYNERSKIKRLGVSDFTLQTRGVVSNEVAYEMATGLLDTGNCDISIATTGFAGPSTGRSMLPVGLCYIAIGLKERVFVYRYKFDGTRDEITETAINYALFLAYKQLKEQ